MYLGGQLLICMEIARSEFRNVREASWFHLTLEADFLVLQDANPKLGSFFCHSFLKEPATSSGWCLVFTALSRKPLSMCEMISHAEGITWKEIHKKSSQSNSFQMWVSFTYSFIHQISFLFLPCTQQC